MLQNLASQQMDIAQWITGLAAILEKDFTLPTVQDYVIQHPVQPASLEKYIFFSKASYTRNLIFKNAVFECMTLCWEIGQRSRIHNHRDQNCWMSAPIGRLKVCNYRVQKVEPANGDCTITPTDSYLLDASHPTFVNPMEPVHEVMNLTEFNQRAVSMHIYSKPFDSCEVYSREKNKYARVPLFYTSEYGKLNPEEKLL
jgi:cysteine dioxygenase